jgi:hypothetical protein
MPLSRESQEVKHSMAGWIDKGSQHGRWRLVSRDPAGGLCVSFCALRAVNKTRLCYFDKIHNPPLFENQKVFSSWCWSLEDDFNDCAATDGRNLKPDVVFDTSEPPSRWKLSFGLHGDPSRGAC